MRGGCSASAVGPPGAAGSDRPAILPAQSGSGTGWFRAPGAAALGVLALGLLALLACGPKKKPPPVWPPPVEVRIPAEPAPVEPEEPELDERPSKAPRFSSPIPGPRITSRFGARPDPYTGRRRVHSGIDIDAVRGQRVFAAADGRVSVASTRYGRNWGTVVVIDHGRGLETLYAHLDRFTVRPGQRVKRGQTIGIAGRTGNATGIHLHFEVWQKGRRVDPALFVEELR